MRRLVFVTVLAVAATCATASVALASTNPCALLTKKQASMVLGFKVVERQRDSEPATGAEECEFRTKKYWAPRLEKIDAPYKLQITTQPLDADVAEVLDQLEAEGEPVDGLGDRAFYTESNDLVVVVGDVVVQAEVTNIEWEGDELQTYVLGPELEAMRLVVAELTKA